MWEYLPTLSLIAFLTLLTYPHSTSANSTTTVSGNGTGGGNSSAPGVHLTATYGTTPFFTASNEVPQVVLTIVVIGACAAVGVLVAKLGDYCYDRHMATRDDISNASEYTKNILKTRLAVMRMKGDPPTEDGKAVKKAAAAWIENASHTKREPKAEGEVDAEKGKAEVSTDKSEPNSTDTVTEDMNSSDAPTITVTSTPGASAPAPTAPAAPAALQLPQNRVAPGVTKTMPSMTVTSKEIKGMPTGGRGNALPPISPRPDPMNKSINQPIRSTR